MHHIGPWGQWTTRKPRKHGLGLNLGNEYSPKPPFEYSSRRTTLVVKEVLSRILMAYGRVMLGMITCDVRSNRHNLLDWQSRGSAPDSEGPTEQTYFHLVPVNGSV